ncbi:hypothetical protein K490DRAFT_59961 [Saccharata proteae CBS 121410]|uniref:Uncharacterized protein n=1 Tax=Saccharata proteae CBS 121410 TaxID=1314787 RepID=A0A9P4HNF3_9PEZI|nr:hypothetical protein K490DRAFT_59961 [Saccharata proteae CBS 121410]
MASRDRLYSHEQPARLPKLHVRNRPSESSTSELLPLEEIAPCPTKPSASVPRDRDHRPQVNSKSARPTRPGTEGSSGTPTTTPTDTKPQRKKSNSMRDFFTMKEPSSTAIEEYKRQQKQQTGGRPEISPLQKLPPHVPPVNSKWDGLPRTGSHSHKGSNTSNQHRRHHSTKSSHTRHSSAQTQTSSRTTTTTSTSTSSSHRSHHPNPLTQHPQAQQPPPSPLTASTIDFDYGPPPSRATTNTTTSSSTVPAVRHDSVNTLGLNFSALHLNGGGSMSDSFLPPSASLATTSWGPPAFAPQAVGPASAPAASVSNQELQVIAPWAEPPPSPSPSPAPRTAAAEGVPVVRLPAESERLLRGSVGGAAGVGRGGGVGGGGQDTDVPLVLNATPRLPRLSLDDEEGEEMGALRRLERVVVRGGRGTGCGHACGHAGGGSGSGSGSAPRRSSPTRDKAGRGMFSRLAGRKK